MGLFKPWVPINVVKIILFLLLVPNLIIFFLPVANEEMAASFYGIEVNDVQFMVSLFYVGFASFYSLERRFYAYLNSKVYFILFQVIQLICCFILFKSHNLLILFFVRFIQGMLFASSVNLYMSLVIKTMKAFWAKEITYSIFFGMLLCTGSLNNLITADALDQFSFGFVYQCAIVIYALAIVVVLITMTKHTQIKTTPLVGLDLPSFIILSTALISIGYLSIYGQQYYWFKSSKISYITLLFGISLLTFLIRQKFKKRPYINLDIFKVKAYWWGIALLFLIYIERFSFAYSGSFYKQILHMDPKHVSYMYALNLMGIVLGVMTSAWMLLYKKRPILLWIAGFSSLFFYHFCMRFLMFGSGNEFYYFLPMFMHGLGVGLIMVPTILHCIGVVPYYLAPSAAAFCLIVRFSGYTASSILTKFYTAYNYNLHYNRFLWSLTNENEFYNLRLNQIKSYLTDHGLAKNQLNAVADQLLKKNVDNEILMRSIMDYYTLMMYLSLLILFLIVIYWLRHKNYKIIFRPLSPI